MRSLQICLLTETYHPVVGGGETQARNLAEHLLASGHRVCIVTRLSDAGLPKMERYGKITVYRRGPAGRGQLKKWGLAISCIPVLFRLRGQWDLVFVSGFRILGATAVLVSRLLGKKVVLKADSLGEMSGAFFEAGLATRGLSPRSASFRLFLAVRNRVLKLADAHVGITPSVAAELADAGIRDGTVHLIPNSVDLGRFRPASTGERETLRGKLALGPARQVVVYTGRLVSYKGLPLLLRVWRDLESSHEGLKLVLVGTGGLDIHNCELELREYVRAHDLHRGVLFTGSVTNVSEYLRAADIFVFPTENDAFPSSLIEAMACQLPVISTPVGAIPTVIEDRGNGLLVAPGDHEELLSALRHLVGSAELRERLGSAALRTVKDRYSSGSVGQRYAELFERTMQRDSGR